MKRLVFTVSILVALLLNKSIAQSDTLSCSIGIAGDAADVQSTTEFGVLLGGGSTDVDEALQWMIRKSGGGDVVIIRASGSTGYNDYIKGLGEVNSVETLLIKPRDKAMRPEVGKRIREAEALFIAGGDQWNYVRFWQDSEVSSAIDYLIHDKHVPVGGTSAGCAVLTDIIFDARNGSATASAIQNPFDSLVSISKSFIRIPFLSNMIADQHYTQRERHARHVAFLARMTDGYHIRKPKGIGVDEKTSVCIDKDGNAIVFGTNDAYFIQGTGKPEQLIEGRSLVWVRNKKALRVYKVHGSKEGTRAFNVKKWTKVVSHYWYVDERGLQE
jgi:cyanophycinase